MPKTFDELIAAAEKISKDGAKRRCRRGSDAGHPVGRDHGHVLGRRL